MAKDDTPKTLSSPKHLTIKKTQIPIETEPATASPHTAVPSMLKSARSTTPAEQRIEISNIEENTSTTEQRVAQTPCKGELGQLTDFPDFKVIGSSAVQLLATIDNVKHLLKIHDISVQYDVIRKETRILFPGLKCSPENYDNVAMSHLMSLANRVGLPTKGLADYIGVIADENRVNPVARWIESKPWDRQDRYTDLFNTLTIREGYPQKLRDILLHRWLLSAVAAVFKPSGFHTRGVVVLQGPQGIGKTTWIARLINDESLRDQTLLCGHHLNIGDKDSKVTAIKHWIVEIGELDSSFKKDIGLLKGFLTNTTDKLRRPYARGDSEYQRRTVFCASVNEDSFLIDPTGNSRWWTIPVVSIDYEHHIDMQQLFAQVLNDFNAGGKWWLAPDEEQMLTQQNREHMAASSISEQLMEQMDLTIPESDRPRMSATQVLQAIGYQRPSNHQCRECGGILRELLGSPKKINGTMKWAVHIVAPAL